MHKHVLLVSDRGFSLIEMMAALAIAAIIIVLTGNFLSVILKGNAQANITVNRDNLIDNIANNAIRLTTLCHSMNRPGNEQFTSCVTGGGCPNFTGSNFYPITLYPNASPDTETVSGPGWPTTPAAAMWFDINGKACAQGSSPQCVMSFETSFRAQCPPVKGAGLLNPETPTCATAAIIQIVYTINFYGYPAAGMPAWNPPSKTHWAPPVQVANFTNPGGC